MILFLVVGVLFVTLAGVFGFESALLTAGFIGLILALLFAYIGVINYWIVGAFVGVTLVTIIYVIWSNRYD
jgi:hypothetical protein